MVNCCVHSLTSGGLVTCRWTVKVTCWSLTILFIAFYCWAVNYNYNASSLTQTLKSSCGSQHDYVTTNSHHNSTLLTAAVRSGRCSSHLTSSQGFICDKFWLWLITVLYIYINITWASVVIVSPTTLDLQHCHAVLAQCFIQALFFGGGKFPPKSRKFPPRKIPIGY